MNFSVGASFEWDLFACSSTEAFLAISRAVTDGSYGGRLRQ